MDKGRLFIFIFTALSLVVTTTKAEECDPARQNPVQDLISYGCDLEKMTSECQKWFKENPDTIEYSRDCKNPKDTRGDYQKLFKICSGAIGEAWGGIWIEMLKSVQRSDEFYQNCESDPELACKKQLAREAHFVYRSDVELRNTFTGDLLRKRDKVRSMALRDAKYREYLLKAGVPLPTETDGIDDFPVNAVLAVAKIKLNQMGVKYQCYNGSGYLRMVCYSAASLVDPAFIAGAGVGGAIKGGKWVAAVLRTGKTSSVARSNLEIAGKSEEAFASLVPAKASFNAQVASTTKSTSDNTVSPALTPAPLDASSRFGPKGRSVVEASRIRDVKSLLFESDVVFFDLDDTVFTSGRTFGSNRWFDWKVEKLKASGLTEEKAVAEARLIKNRVVDHDYRIVDEEIKDLIRELRAKGKKVFALTARPLSQAQDAVNALRKVNVEFTENKIIYTAGSDKGVKVRDFLREQSIDPKKIAVVDDKLENIESVVSSRRNVVGVHLTTIETELPSFRSDVAEIQENVFRKTGQLISDEEATALLKKSNANILQFSEP